MEQNINHVLKLAEQAYGLENVHIVLSGTGCELLNNEYMKKASRGV